jgi:CRP-like cAMP-binding protein
MTSLSSHPQRNSVRLQLRQNPLLRGISNSQWSELEPLLLVAAWRLRTPVPYSIVAVTKVRTVELSMPVWAEFLDKHTPLKERFEYEVMKLMSEVMAHSITLHLLDAPGRLSRFQRKHPELAGRIPKKELAAYLNLTPETLSRLKQKYGEP